MYIAIILEFDILIIQIIRIQTKHHISTCKNRENKGALILIGNKADWTPKSRVKFLKFRRANYYLE